MTPLYEINKELVLSTAHMPEALAQSMDKGEDLDISYDRVDSGYLVYTLHQGDYPVSIQPAILVARKHCCKWLRFDTDGPRVEGLQTWEW